MAETQIRSIFKNDSVMGRHLDGDDDSYDESPRSSVFSTDSETLTNGSLLTTTTTNSSRVGGRGAVGSSGAYNTGPKGVRSDARAFNQSQSDQQSSKLLAQKDLDDTMLRAQANTWSQDRAENDARDRWVEKRLKELSKNKSATNTVERVDATRYLECIETCKNVAVCIYSESEECEQFLAVLPPLANKYAGLKIVTLSHAEAEMDHIACPALLVYENGNLVVNLMRVVDELDSGEEISFRTIEQVLLQTRALKQHYRID